ncbi:MAG TPA: hypothetical protein VGU71_19050 [Candidatus Dormibacteraeota bacterium]|nr:hypothetical protein [Candidatus Dormibacteraeota bacterium]
MLQIVFDAWRENVAWPKWLYVHYEMKARGLDASAVLRTMPLGLVSGVSMGYPQGRDTASLTISGINYCERAQAQKEAFMALLRLAQETDRSHHPKPTDDAGPEIRESELLARVPAEMLKPMSEVLDHWIGVLSPTHRAGTDHAEWVLMVSQEVQRFQAVKDLDEYVLAVAEWLRPPIGGRPSTRQIFVLMPFEDRQQPVYDAIRAAVATVKGYICKRSDEITTPGRISFQIIEAIQRADLIIVDLWGHNPNVMYELGFAHAAGKPTILLAPRRYQSPFDIHDWRYIEYSHAELEHLTKKLAAWLGEPSILATLPASSPTTLA